MIRATVIATTLMLSGCAVLRDVGDLQILNDVGLGKTREAISTVDKTLSVFGVYRQRQINTSNANIAVGHAKALKERVAERGVQTRDIPQMLNDTQDLLEYLK